MGQLDFLSPIIQLIEKKLGLKPRSVSLLIWEWVLKERMTLCNLSSYEDYYHRLRLSSHELQELIELIVVPETWFFRDKGGLDFLVYLTGKGKCPSPFLKIMSLPCSTGEEPYSIAMALSNMGMPKTSFIIHAVDISKKAIIKAQVGIYGKNSFRGKDLAYRERYFEKTRDGYAIQANIKKQVRFYCYNVLNEQMPFERGSYQFVFCRNLLIYLDEYAQQRALALMKSFLAPNGILIVGPAETQLVHQAGFIPVRFPRAYAFCLETATKMSTGQFMVLSEASHHQTLPPAKLPIEKSEDQETPFLSPKKASEPLPVVSPIGSLEKEALLQQANKFADQGEFEESIDLCLRFMSLYGANASIYYLLGLIQHAMGDESKAEEFFHKAVYLDPYHYEGLIYLALLAEKKGDLNKAELFRKRAQKTHKNQMSE